MAGVSICLHHATRIVRTAEPEKWAELIEKIPEECRGECRRYLRDMYKRAMVIRRLHGKVTHK